MSEQNTQDTLSFKTKITRGATGRYGWEISVYGAKTELEADHMNAQAVKSINNAIAYADQNIYYPNIYSPAKNKAN